MESADSHGMLVESVERQKAYVEEMKRKAPGSGIVFADAFIRGMRDIGYKSPAWALAEIIDNSVQASASIINVCLGYQEGNKSRAKPDHIAVVDNGSGMIPPMIGYAVRWGGTDRADDRSGFGRYGYGLPSSAISIASRYTVYSKVAGQDWYAVTVDIRQLAEASNNLGQIESFLSPRRENPPEWLNSRELGVSSLESGTVVLLEDLDRLRELGGWITRKALVPKLLRYFGVIYRHWIPAYKISVDGTPVQAVDPLFLMAHGRYFAEDDQRAVRVETRNFEVKNAEGKAGSVRIRASYMPPTFQRLDPARTDSQNMNNRGSVIFEFNGLLVCRGGRQIDCVPPKWTKFQNYDANLKVEIDFDPILDEYFGITTSKQQIVIRDEMWEKLRSNGRGGGDVFSLIRDLRKKLKKLRLEDEARRNSAKSEEDERLSERAMGKAEQFKMRRTRTSDKRKKEAAENLVKAAEELARTTGKTKEETLRELGEVVSRRRWQIEFRALEEGPFYVPHRIGEQKRVILNTAHPFYQKVYARNPKAHASLEVLLFVLSEGEFDAEGPAEEFYQSARHDWSERLRQTLLYLEDEQLLDDEANLEEEEVAMEA